MAIAGVRKNQSGTFTLRIKVGGTAKTVAKQVAIGLSTRDPAEADERAKVVKNALMRAELIKAGKLLDLGRPKKQP